MVETFRRYVLAMSSVLIGITSSPGARDGSVIEGVNRPFVDGVIRAGGVPVVLPVLDPGEAPAVLDRLDGVLLSGGGDVEPAIYRAKRAPETDTVDPARDAFEIALFRAAVRRHLPVLGICRGAQVINVARGGTLIQHLPALGTIDHQEKERFSQVIHHVEVVPGTRLAGVLGSDRIGVNTLHHQAVDRLGRGLRPVAWATDEPVDVIEGIELVGRDVLGVQWHPELLPDAPEHQALFRWLVSAAEVHGLPVPTEIRSAKARRPGRRAVA